MNKRFYKTPEEDWFIDLPEWIAQGGPKEALQMVLGADTMLDILAQDSDSVMVQISSELLETNNPKYQLTLLRLEDVFQIGDPEGFWGVYKATPLVATYPEIEEVFLCPVTKYVLNDYPEVIYIN